MQTKEIGTKSINIRLALYKIGITTCLGIIISMFLFACGSAKDTSSNTDTTAAIQTDTSSVAPVDTASMPADTTGTGRDTIPMH